MNSTDFTETLSEQQQKDTIWRINSIQSELREKITHYCNKYNKAPLTNNLQHLVVVTDILKKALKSLNIDQDEVTVSSLLKSCSFTQFGVHQTDVDLYQESSRLSFDARDISFISNPFWAEFCEDRDLVSWNGFCKRLQNKFKTGHGKTDVMKALVLLERWKEEDKLIRRRQFTLFTQGLQTALYVFESKGLPLNLNSILAQPEKLMEKLDTRKIMGDITKELFKEDEKSNVGSNHGGNNVNVGNVNSTKVRKTVGKSPQENEAQKQGLKLKKSNSNKEVLHFRTGKGKGAVDIPKLDLNVIRPNERKLVQSKSFVNEVHVGSANNSSAQSQKEFNKSFCEDKQKIKTRATLGLKVKQNSLKDGPANKVINCARTPEPSKTNASKNTSAANSSSKKLRTANSSDKKQVISQHKEKGPNEYAVSKLVNLLSEKSKSQKESAMKKFQENWTAAKTNQSMVSAQNFNQTTQENFQKDSVSKDNFNLMSANSNPQVFSNKHTANSFFNQTLPNESTIEQQNKSKCDFDNFSTLHEPLRFEDNMNMKGDMRAEFDRLSDKIKLDLEERLSGLKENLKTQMQGEIMGMRQDFSNKVDSLMVEQTNQFNFIAARLNQAQNKSDSENAEKLSKTKQIDPEETTKKLKETFMTLKDKETMQFQFQDMIQDMKETLLSEIRLTQQFSSTQMKNQMDTAVIQNERKFETSHKILAQSKSQVLDSISDNHKNTNQSLALKSTSQIIVKCLMKPFNLLKQNVVYLKEKDRQSIIFQSNQKKNTLHKIFSFFRQSIMQKQFNYEINRGLTLEKFKLNYKSFASTAFTIGQRKMYKQFSQFTQRVVQSKLNQNKFEADKNVQKFKNCQLVLNILNNSIKNIFNQFKFNSIKNELQKTVTLNKINSSKQMNEINLFPTQIQSHPIVHVKPEVIKQHEVVIPKIPTNISSRKEEDLIPSKQQTNSQEKDNDKFNNTVISKFNSTRNFEDDSDDSYIEEEQTTQINTNQDTNLNEDTHTNHTEEDEKNKGVENNNENEKELVEENIKDEHHTIQPDSNAIESCEKKKQDPSPENSDHKESKENIKSLNSSGFLKVTSQEFDNMNFVFNSDNRPNSYDRQDEKPKSNESNKLDKITEREETSDQKQLNETNKTNNTVKSNSINPDSSLNKGSDNPSDKTINSEKEKTSDQAKNPQVMNLNLNQNSIKSQESQDSHQIHNFNASITSNQTYSTNNSIYDNQPSDFIKEKYDVAKYNDNFESYYQNNIELVADLQAVDFAHAFDEDIESYHQELNETLNKINCDDGKVLSHTLQRTKSKSTLPGIVDFSQTEKLDTGLNRRQQKNSISQGLEMADPLQNNKSLSEGSKGLNPKQEQHQSACSYNVSSNNSQRGLEEEINFADGFEELDIQMDNTLESGDQLGVLSKNLSSKLKQSKISLDLQASNMDLDDNFELEDEDFDNIDKDINEEPDFNSGVQTFKFNKTVKGGLGSLI